ncbi:MAG: oligosaccharide flippase family protein [Alphaproteobacteria bacterium]|jgi:O-antigen/teichoic acid export membrane protein|nr:oligosaccharide flippase family protein [Alphaproteobacteria bacterium]
MLTALVVLARILNPTEMGIFAVGQAIGGVLTAISTIGLVAFIVRESKIDRSLLGTAFVITLALSLTLAAAIFFSAPEIARWVGDERVANMVRLISMVPIIGAFELTPQALMQRNMQFGRLAWILGARSFALTAVAIGTAWAGYTYMCAAYAAIASAFVSAAGANIAAPGNFRVAFDFNRWRQISLFSLKILAISGISVLAMRASDPIMASILGLAVLGIYSRASSIYNTIYTSIFGALSRVIMARLAIDLRNGTSLNNTYIGGLHLILGFILPFILGLAILSQPTVLLVFGANWLGTAAPLTVLMLAQALALTFAMSHELFILRDEIGRQTKIEIFRSVAGTAFFIVGCYYGMVGAALGRVAEIALAAAMYIPHIIRLGQISWLDYLLVLRKNLVVAGAAIAPSLALMIYFEFSPYTPLSLVLASVMAGVAAWALSLHYVNHPLSKELKMLLATLVSRLFSHKRNRMN